MAPQTFFPQTYYYSTGQVLHTAASSPNSAAALVLDDGTLSHHALSDDMSNGHHGRPFSAQSMHQNMQPPMQQLHEQQQHPQHRQQRLPAGMTYQLSPQTGVPTYVAYTTSHGPGNHRMMGNSHAPNEYHTIHNPPMSPVLAHGFTYSQAGSQRGSVDMGQQYRHVQFTPMSPQSFASPVLGGQHLRYSTVDSAFSTSSPYTSTDHAAAPPAYTPQASRLSTNAQSPPQPTELARGHLAQSKFREALGAYDPNARLPISASERRRAAASEARLPKPPAHSPWAMWVGNVPSDATHSELWRFFVSRPPPGPPIPGSKEEEDTLEAEAEYPPGPDQPPPDYNTVGIESVHLISRSNCCFVNMASKRHLDHAIKVSHGLSLRPHDPRCKPLVCRVRKKDDDNKTGVGAQRGKGMHQAWAAEKEKDRRLADAEVEVSNIIAKDAAAPLSPPAESDIHGTRNGSASTVHSASTSSTTSSFLQRHFPRRYFILKVCFFVCVAQKNSHADYL